MKFKRAVAASLLAVIVSVFALPGDQEGSRTKLLPASEVERLVAQLGSKIYRERAEAERKLLELDDDTLPRRTHQKRPAIRNFFR